MTAHDGPTADEGVLDPWVTDWMAANPGIATPMADFPPEILELARGPMGAPPTREIAHVADEEVDGIPVRIYRNEGAPTGLVVYFHGGGYVLGSIGIMDNVARELAHGSGAVVVSVGYRLAPEDPYPAGLDDCERVTRWAVANAARFGVSPASVVVAGESAGGNLATAVALRLRGRRRPDPGRPGAHLPAAVREDDVPVRGRVRRPRHRARDRQEVLGRVQRRTRPRPRSLRRPPERGEPAGAPTRDRGVGRVRHVARRGPGVRGPSA